MPRLTGIGNLSSPIVHYLPDFQCTVLEDDVGLWGTPNGPHPISDCQVSFSFDSGESSSMINLCYSTGQIDQDWQRKFTIIWASVLAFSIVISLPLLVRALRRGTALKGLLGISEVWYRNPQYRGIKPSTSVKRGQSQGPRKIEAALNRVVSPLWWRIPGLSLNVGQGISRSLPITNDGTSL
jgi:hypothetical protein